ncbi:MAG: formylmethanofuran--tetrahydromethanopterin N-formyltransferase, partial [Planctomycetota bacterium]
QAANALTGFGTSVIACGIEIDVERELSIDETPDGRFGLAILAFAASSKELYKQIPRRVGQCVLTCPTTAIFGGTREIDHVDPTKKRIDLGKSLRYFGDGHQISKVIDDVRYWRIPVMDGEFVCEHDVPRFAGIGGGNFLLCGDSVEAVTQACRSAIAAIRKVPGVITPFPGGATRSGSKVGSKYAALFASTNEAFCPSLRHHPHNQLAPSTTTVMEVVIDGIDGPSISTAMRQGILAAASSQGGKGLHRITAGNYGGKLGRHHYHLHPLLQNGALQNGALQNGALQHGAES